MNPNQLTPEFQKVVDELNHFNFERAMSVQKRMDRREVAKQLDGEYSLNRLLHGMRMDSVARTAPYELMVSQHEAERIGREPHPGFYFVPSGRVGRRDLTVASAAGGGFLVGTDINPGQTFVHYLDQFFPFERLGITRISLQRPALIPQISGTVSTTWLVNEGSTITESQFTFVQAATSPKVLGAYVEVSDQFLKQTSSFAQTFVFQALARAVSAELSRKLLTGSGANGQLQGVFGYTGVNTVAAGSANYSKVLDMIETVEVANAMLTPGSAGFVMPSNVAKMLRARERATGSGTIMLANDVSGFLGTVTAGTSPNTMTFGDWSQLALMEYNVLEIGTDPFGANSSLFKTGLVGVRVLWTIDSILLNPKSICTSGALS